MLGELAETDLGAAAQLVARGMHDNPINLRVFGERDGRVLARFFGLVLHGLHRRGTIVGPSGTEPWSGYAVWSRRVTVSPLRLRS